MRAANAYSALPMLAQAAVAVPPLIALYYLAMTALVWIYPRGIVVLYRIFIGKLAVSDFTTNRFLSLPLSILVQITFVSRVLAHPRVLDGWVNRRIPTIAKSFEQIKAIKDRRLFLPLPVLVHSESEAHASHTDVLEITPTLFARERFLLVVQGPGGAGKSSLAFAVARCGLADESKPRLAPYYVIPIVIGREIEDIVAAISDNLKRLCEPTHLVEDFIVEPLLSAKRILVIFDALSEKSPKTQALVRAAHGRAPINAMIVTSRADTEFDNLTPTIFFPQKLGDDAVLLTFINSYIQAALTESHFRNGDGTQPIDIKRLVAGVFSLVERARRDKQTVTPLLVKLFIDNVLHDPAKAIVSISVPETFLDYLKRTNPQEREAALYLADDDLIFAARALGSCSLGDDYIPKDFTRDRATEFLANAGWRAVLPDPLKRLAENGVLTTRNVAGTTYYRFSFDPLAEYLAAMYYCDKLKDRAQDWMQFIVGLKREPRHLDAIEGFLLALDECVEFYRRSLGIPPEVLPLEMVSMRSRAA